MRVVGWIVVTVVLASVGFVVGRYVHADAEADELRSELAFLPGFASRRDHPGTAAEIGRMTQRLLELRGIEPDPGGVQVDVAVAADRQRHVSISVTYQQSILPGWSRPQGTQARRVGDYFVQAGNWESDF